MANKNFKTFYISNAIQFMDGTGMGKSIPACASHMRYNAAAALVAKNPDCIVIKVRTTEKHNDYVISTRQKFWGKDNTVVNNMAKARGYNSAQEAWDDYDSHRNIIPGDLICVIDQDYHRYDRAIEPIVFEKEPEKPVSIADVFAAENGDSTERIILPAKLREELYRRDGGICQLCGKPVSSYTYTVDHIVPLARGGTNHPDNLRIAHKDCNRLKGCFMDGEMTAHSAATLTNSIATNYEDYSEVAAQLIRAVVRGSIAAYTGKTNIA